MLTEVQQSSNSGVLQIFPILHMFRIHLISTVGRNPCCTNRCSSLAASEGTTLHCTVIQYATLHCTTLNYAALHLYTLHYTFLQFTSVQFTSLHCTSLHCTTLQCTELHCSALTHSAVHYTV